MTNHASKCPLCFATLGVHFMFFLLRAQVRSTDVVNGCREDVDTALLKLYAEQDHDSLLDLLVSDNSCVLADSIPWLEKYHKYVYFKDEVLTKRSYFLQKLIFI